MQNGNAEQVEPTIRTYPTIEIDGQPVQVIFKLGDVMRLKREHGIDILARDLDNIERTLTILSVGISHSIKVTAEELGDMFDFGDIAYVGEIVAEATKKVSLEAAIPAQQRAQQRTRLTTITEPV
jgi:hypothetical protein